ncbi:hypothetical protein ACERZ8_10125 [Tateyamaria armeniaca]|uniref:Excinuclease ABC subunit A n=1 Tax=Tateyamaria armeniaca TaxID=2518930 RepID=A0ABW8UTH1_9RHOB
MKNPVLTAILGLVLAWPAVASAQSIFLRELVVIPVRPIDTNTFEVIENDGAGGTSMWCAASKFTRDYLNQRGGEIAVLRARGDSAAFPGRKSVIFTTAPVASPVKSTSQGVRTEGQVFSMGHANALCRSQPEILIQVRVVAQ